MGGVVAVGVKGVLWFLRVAMAAVWLYNGLWLKVIARDPHHWEIVRSAFGEAWAGTALTVIGLGETLLAVGILSGLWPRFVQGFQIALLLAMNAAGIFFAGDEIADPVGLVVGNLPLVACAVTVFVLSPRDP